MTTLASGDRAARPERIRLCARHLRRVVAAHFDRSSVAIYLWGSVLSDEFSPDSSDVDLLLISASPPEPGTVERLTTSAARSHPLLARLDVSAVTLSELALRSRARLRNRIDAALLVAQAPEWRFVWGARDLVPADALQPCSLQRQLQLRRKCLTRRLRIHAEDALAEPDEYILKELGFICHLVHQLQAGEHSFSYRALQAHATTTTREAVETLVEARRLGWRDRPCIDVVDLAQRLSAALDSAK